MWEASSFFVTPLSKDSLSDIVAEELRDSGKPQHSSDCQPQCVSQGQTSPKGEDGTALTGVGGTGQHQTQVLLRNDGELLQLLLQRPDFVWRERDQHLDAGLGEEKSQPVLRL